MADVFAQRWSWIPLPRSAKRKTKSATEEEEVQDQLQTLHGLESIKTGGNKKTQDGEGAQSETETSRQAKKKKKKKGAKANMEHLTLMYSQHSTQPHL